MRRGRMSLGLLERREMGREGFVGRGIGRWRDGAWRHAGVVARCCWLGCILDPDHNVDLADWVAVGLKYLVGTL